MLVHLRGRVVREAKSRLAPGAAGDGRASAACSAPAARYERAQRLARGGPRAAAALRGLPRLDARCASCPTVPEQLVPRVVGASASGGRGRGTDRSHDGRRTTHERARGRPRAASATALGAGAAVPDVPRGYHGPGAGAPAGDPAVVARFCERAAEYRATVRRVAAAELDGGGRGRARRARRAARRGRAGRAARSRRRRWSAWPTTRRSRRATSTRSTASLTGCAAAIAETGTVVLDGGAAQRPAAAHARARPARLRRRGRDVARRRPGRDRRAGRRRRARAGRSRSSPARARRPTSSSSGWRASTGRARS